MMFLDIKGIVKLKNGKVVIFMGIMKEFGFCDCCLMVKLGGKIYFYYIKVGFFFEKF